LSIVNNQCSYVRRGRSHERGFSMIELAVALVVALFLLNGMFMILQNTRNASNNQTGLSKLQDAQRMSMVMLTDIIQEAGYFPQAHINDATVIFPVGGVFATAGQSVFGAVNTTAANGDTITIRLQGDSGNGVIDCRGGVVPSGTVATMTYSVSAWPGGNSSNLINTGLACSMDGGTTQMYLIPNISSMTVVYGVDATNSGGTNAYLTAAQVTTANLWTAVDSVKITLNYANPLAYNANKTASTIILRQNIPFSRVINIMSKTGVNALTVN
jgi:type IV pilus assembly protein PilW